MSFNAMLQCFLKSFFIRFAYPSEGEGGEVSRVVQAIRKDQIGGFLLVCLLMESDILLGVAYWVGVEEKPDSNPPKSFNIMKEILRILGILILLGLFADCRCIQRIALHLHRNKRRSAL